MTLLSSGCKPPGPRLAKISRACPSAFGPMGSPKCWAKAAALSAAEGVLFRLGRVRRVGCLAELAGRCAAVGGLQSLVSYTHPFRRERHLTRLRYRYGK